MSIFKKRNNDPKPNNLDNQVSGNSLEAFLDDEIAILDHFDKNKPQKKPAPITQAQTPKSKALIKKEQDKKYKAALKKNPLLLKRKARFLTVGITLITFGIAGPLLSFALVSQINKDNKKKDPEDKRKKNETPIDPGKGFEIDEKLPAIYNGYVPKKSSSEVDGAKLIDLPFRPEGVSVESYQIHGRLLDILVDQIKFNYGALYSDISNFARTIYNYNKAYFKPVGENKVEIKQSNDKNPLHVNITGSLKFKNDTSQTQTFVMWYFNSKYEQKVDPNGEVDIKFNTLSSANDVNPLQQRNYIGSYDPINLIPGFSYLNVIVTKSVYYDYYLNWNVSNLGLSINNRKLKFTNFIFNNTVPTTNIKVLQTTPGKNPYEAADQLVGKGKLLNRDLTTKQISNNLKNTFLDLYYGRLEIFNLLHDVLDWIIENENNDKYLYELFTDKAEAFARFFSFNFSSLNIGYSDQRNAVQKLIIDALRSNSRIPNAKTVYEVLYDNLDAFKLILSTYFIDISGYDSIFQSLTKDIHSARDFYQKVYETMPLLRRVIQLYPTRLKYFNIIEKLLGYLDDNGTLIPIPRQDIYLIDRVFKSPVLFNEIFDLLINVTTSGSENGDDIFNKVDQSLSYSSFFNFLFVKNKQTLVNLLTSTSNYLDDLIEVFSTNNFQFLTELISAFGFNVKNFDSFIQTALDLVVFKNPELLSRDKFKAKILNLFSWARKILEPANINKLKFSLYKPENFNNIELIETKDSLKIKNLDVGFKFDINSYDIPYGFVSSLFDFLPDIRLDEFVKLLIDNERYEQLKESAYNQAVREGYATQLNLGAFITGKWSGNGGKAFLFEKFDDIWKNQVMKGLTQNGRTIRDIANEIFLGSNNIDLNRPIITFKGTGYFKYHGKNLDILPYFRVLPSNTNESQIAYQIYDVKLDRDFRDIYKNITLHFEKYNYEKPSIPFGDLSKKVYETIADVVRKSLRLSLNRIYSERTRIVLPGSDGYKKNLILNEANPYENIALFSYDANLSVINNFDRATDDQKRQIRERVLNIQNRRSLRKGIHRDPQSLVTSIDAGGLSLLDSLVQVNGVDKKWIVRDNESLSTILEPNKISLDVTISVGLISRNVPINVSYETFITWFKYKVLLPYPILDRTNPNNPKFAVDIWITHFVFSIEIFGFGEV
ncbi:P116 family lipid acquisition surface protein [Mycoplasma sp. E35C]|uniref:P116 family lipid acquisition surface protein n=1 Tax=Mycoplasma sp. E35C TaxID=2801918 RepID=UPI001CA3D703|nr:hypothetical protein [Mycoplasma sp. E35C]QZX49317.1 hypothetical protein JJE79_01000 [Mycoplasma sp. E35C]